LGKIFISHSSANNAEALAIHDWLSEQGWGDVFLDLDPKRGLVAGDRWQAALKAAAEQCELILIIISPDWAKSRWCLAEFLLAKQMNKQILGVVVKHTPIADLPVELTAEWQLVDLSATDPGWSVTISPPRFEPETTVTFSGTGLARLRSGLEKAGLDATTFLWPPQHDLGRSPYRGLLPLDEDDAGIFFGRDGAIVLTLDALRGLRAGAAPRFATILGASGSGKSSFLRAGILPRLKRDSRHFYVLPIIRPERAALSGEHGFGAMLEAALKARNVIRNRADIRDAVQAGAGGVAPILRDLAVPLDAGDADKADPATLVIAVDQAEELLTADNAEAGAFLTLLAELGRRDDPAVMVIFTVRSDSFDQLQSRPELASTQPHHLIDLPPVPAGSFGDIIRGPARRVTAAGRKLLVDETLVDALLSDIEKGGTKDALPLLAFTLERLYTDYGADGDLQLGEYERLGRIRGAIEAAVEEALKKADGNAAIPKDRAARLALLRRGLIPWLAGIDPNTGSPRRRVARIAEVPEEARPLIELMVEQRLLATDVDSATKERTIEPAHEALLRQWGALDGWLAEDSADLSIVEALRRAATEWDANARASEFLAHRGARLQSVEQVAAGDKFASYLTSVDRAYLSAARNLENGAIKKARAARTRAAIAASIVGAVLIAGGVVGYFVWSAGEAAKVQAQVNFLIAQSESALRSGRPEDGAKAALAAYELAPSSASRTAALQAVMAIPLNGRGSLPAEGTIIDALWTGTSGLAVLAADGTVTTLDLAIGQSAVTSPSGDNQAVGLVPGSGNAHVAYSDGSILATDGTVIAAAPAAMFFGQAGTLSASADGKVIAMRGLIGDALLRDCRTLPCVDQSYVGPNGEPVTAIAVRPDGGGVAYQFGDQPLIIVNDRSKPDEIITGSDFGAIARMVWGGASGRIGVATQAGQIFAMDPLRGRTQQMLEGEGPPRDIAWSPAADLLAIPCGEVNDRMVCTYAAMQREGRKVERLGGHSQTVTLFRWSPDGSLLASVAPNEPIRFWSTENDMQVAWLLNNNSRTALTALAVDDATRLVVAGGEVGGAWSWQADATAVDYVPAFEDPLRVASVALTSADRFAAVYENRAIGFFTLGKPDADKVVTLDNATFSRVAALTGDIRAAVPLTDGRILTFSGDDYRQGEVVPDGMKLTPWGIAAAPAANEAFISYSDGSIRRRNLGSGAEGATVFDASQPLCGAGPTSDNNGAKSLDVSDDGKWLAATRSDAKVIVHNLADSTRPICMDLPAPDSKTVAFSPDSTRLAILSATDRLYVFDLSSPDSAIILGAPAVPEGSSLAVAAGPARTTSWLDWLDDQTLAIATTAGAVEMIRLDPASWRARVDSLIAAP
jgi:WD40 repeat protein